ncbi:MFS transporter [Streptomyces longisporoflavus]|uniref:MFS transporter n=1 Tax=Streptomyces longisporoflavus TaxID=28044 RepID=A0ABW7QP93_9ACTN
MTRRFLTDYRDLTALPDFWRLAAVGMASKLPPGMVSLGLLLRVGRDHSYGTAGLAVSALAVGQGTTAPPRGRLVDRCAVRPVLLGCLALHLTATLALVLVARGGGPAPVLLALAAAMGASAPPVAVMMRATWHRSTDSRTLTTAMALDSSMMGAALICGPVLASWLSLGISPVMPFAVVAVLTAVAVALLVNSESPPPHTTRGGHRAGPLASAPLRRLLAANALFVMTVTAVDVVLPFYAREHHAAGFTGLYLGALSVGSVLGSLVLGAVPSLLFRGPKVAVLLCLFAAGTAALTPAARLSPLAVLAVCPLAGLVIGCTFAALRTVGGDLAPEGRVTETMSWLSSLDMVGGAVGAAVFAQVAAGEGSRTALLVIPVIALLAAAIVGNPRTRKQQ